MLRPTHKNLELSVGSCVLRRDDFGAKLILSNKKSFAITLPESSILETLIKNDPLISTKEALVIAAWGSPDIIGSNSLSVAITNLRKVLKLDNIKIVNIPRKGYKIQLSESRLWLETSHIKKVKLSFSPSIKINRHLEFLKWIVIKLCLTSNILVVIIYFYFWYEIDIITVNFNNQASKATCLMKKSEMQSILAYYEKESALKKSEIHPPDAL